MAHCVISMVVDTDNHDAYVAACVVHARYAPCPYDGAAASPTPLHAWTEQAFEDTLRMWQQRAPADSGYCWRTTAHPTTSRATSWPRSAGASRTCSLQPND